MLRHFESQLDFLARGDVLHGATPRDDLSGVAEYRSAMMVDMAHRAVGPHDAMFVVEIARLRRIALRRLMDMVNGRPGAPSP
jgi:hypothetical protein